ncbi:putative zinc-type alcohol dehydrogenase-like protein YjmD [Christensenellaceae bacterium]|nr:putative zinc-type alcohol dehydrogenase-like protein YjmD [Christensenellaceae bacterium]BDF60080.1 putative zinc-type alcohol dehydrogenase-like protein YjmD [Christensenellaceae bacterium]
MKKFVLSAPYTIETEDAPIPEITDDQVLLRIGYIGICGSDIQMYHGLHKYMTYPVVIGHEVSAIVEKTGKNVSGYTSDELVTVEPQVFCGECWPCRIGRFNVCQRLRVMGVHQDGFACEYFAIDPCYLHSCKGLDPRLAALIEPLAVGIGSVKRAGSLAGQNVVVVGAGTIGNLAAQSAQALGAARVMVTDINQKKLDYAKECGIEYCVNTSAISLPDAIDKYFGMQRADVIVDCAATRGSFASILQAARPSSKIIVTGNFKVPVEIEMPVLQRQEISLIGHMMYVREDFADAIRFAANGDLKLDGFITKVYPSDKLKEAFAFIDENPDDVMKIVISMQE